MIIKLYLYKVSIKKS